MYFNNIVDISFPRINNKYPMHTSYAYVDISIIFEENKKKCSFCCCGCCCCHICINVSSNFI